MPLLDKSFGSRCKAVFVGLATVDAEYFIDDLPQRNEKITASSQQIVAGGPATNAAITFAFLGGPASLISAVGLHPLGDVIRHDLQRFGIPLCDIASQREEAPPLSSIFVLRNGGDRSVVSANAGAFSTLQHRLDPQWLQDTSIVLVDGHYMPLCLAAAASARSRGIRVVLDAGSWKPGTADLLSSVDVAICSVDFRPPECQSDADVFSYLRGQGVSSVAITRGERPVSYVENGLPGEIPIPRIDAVDTLGAGDVFHGAFCYLACQPGQRFLECLEFATRVASFSCRYPGTRTWMEAFPGVDAIRQSFM